MFVRYNKADVIIRVTDAGVVASSGNYIDGCATVLAPSSGSSFVGTAKTFYDEREQSTVRVTDINVAASKTWAEAANPIKALTGRTPATVHVDDLHTPVTGQQSGVRLINGVELPENGLRWRRLNLTMCRAITTLQCKANLTPPAHTPRRLSATGRLT